MRTLILSQFYPPEPCAAANRVAALAERLAADGHEVTVLTGYPSFPAGVVDRRYDPRRFGVERVGAVRVLRVPTYASARQRGRDRIFNWLSVALGASLRVLDPRTRYELIVVSTPPITLVVPALAARLAHRAPLVSDVRDVFPEVAIEMGMWKRGSAIARAVGFAADRLYAAARLVVGVTPSARREIVARGVPEEKVILAPNGFDAVPLAEEPAYRPGPDEIVIAYVGNMGLATGLDVVLDAASRLAGDPRLTFVLIGGGADAEHLRERIERESLRNVKMLGVLPRAVAMKTLEAAQLCVVPLRENIRDSLPTKLFDALALGCPVVVSAAGEARRVVEESGGGIAVEPGDGAALAEAIVALAGDPARRAACAAAGRAYVYEHYDRARIMAQLAARLAALAVRPVVRALAR